MLLVIGRCRRFVLAQVWAHSHILTPPSCDFVPAYALHVWSWCFRWSWAWLMLCIAGLHSCCTEQMFGQLPRKGLAVSEGSHHPMTWPYVRTSHSVAKGLTCYLSSAACHFHRVLGHCSSRRRQFKPWVFGNWKPSTSSLLLSAHSEKVNVWLDNTMWSRHSTTKASFSPSCGKSRSACHVAVAVHRRW